jgi:hypothetical protein
MTGTRNAEMQSFNVLLRPLALVAAAGILSIGLILWTLYAGMPETSRTLLVLLNFVADGILVNHFILKQVRRTRRAAR